MRRQKVRGFAHGSSTNIVDSKWFKDGCYHCSRSLLDHRGQEVALHEWATTECFFTPSATAGCAHGLLLYTPDDFALASASTVLVHYRVKQQGCSVNNGFAILCILYNELCLFFLGSFFGDAARPLLLLTCCLYLDECGVVDWFGSY